MNKTARILELRRRDPSLTLTEIADEIGEERDFVAQVIAKQRKKGVYVPRGTSTSKGHVGRYTSRKQPQS